MEILERFKQIIASSPMPLVFEFGACDGYHSGIMIGLLQESGRLFDYHLFEPSKDLVPIITSSLNHRILASNSSRVKIFNKAIGANNGLFTFYKSGGEKRVNGNVVDRYYGSSSIRKPKLVTTAWTDMTFVEETCEIITLDSHVEHYGLKGRVIDFIWADIQGAEVDLINGGKDSFKNVKYFYTEYANSEYYEGEINLSQICAMLPDFEIVEDYGGDVLLRNKLIK